MSPFTIDVPRARAYSPSPSSLSSSPASSGIYVPVHKRRSAVSPAPSSASFSSSSSSSSHSHNTYTREDLLMLASSPLSRQPLDTKLVQTFPTILKENGREIQRALNMTKGLPTRPRRHGRRSRKPKSLSGSLSGEGSTTDASSTRHDSDEEYAESNSNGLLL